MKTLIMMLLICLLALVIELDFFMALPKFGAKHFGAPDDIKELVKDIPDKKPIVELCGIVILLASFAGVIAVLVWSVLDTWHSDMTVMQVFLRFLVILWGYKFFDIACFDWLLLTKVRFPEKLYPVTKGAKGYDSFGFNAKSQTIKLVLFAVLAILMAVAFSFTHG